MKFIKALRKILSGNLMSENSSPIKTIVFCDPGLDDLLMLIQILSSPDYKVVGIIPVSGNATCRNTTNNTLALCELLDKTEISVYPGSDYDKDIEDQLEETAVYGKNGLGGKIKLPLVKKMMPQKQNGVEFTVQALKEDKHLLIFTSVLTEPAKVFEKLQLEQPETFKNILAISMMGGVINSTQEANWPIGENRFSEANVAYDAKSSEVVFDICNKNQIPIFLAPLDLTHSILVSVSDISHIEQIKNPASNLVLDIIKDIPPHYQKRYQAGPDKEFRQPLHDFHSSNCLLHPNLYNGHWVTVNVHSYLEPHQMIITDFSGGNVFLLDSHYIHRAQFFALLANDLKYFQYLTVDKDATIGQQDVQLNTAEEMAGDSEFLNKFGIFSSEDKLKNIATTMDTKELEKLNKMIRNIVL